MKPEPGGDTIQAERGPPAPGDLLTVERLEVEIASGRGAVHAVQDVSLRMARNEVVGLVGESGSGKTMTALSVIGLLPRTATVTSGAIRLGDTDLLALDERRRSDLRGAEISMVFQDPASYLNPLMRVGEQVAESFRLHQDASRSAARASAIEILGEMRIPNPRRAAAAFPFQLSGGQRQRVLIAIALASRPSLVIADEPTSALDVITQEQILDLLESVVRDFDTSLLLISHDLAIIASLCHRVYVMYAGQIMESGGAAELLRAPRHPYTVGLSRSMLSIDEYKADIPTIPGGVPDLRVRPAGCPFAPRCEHAFDACVQERPPRFGAGPGQEAACWLHGGRDHRGTAAGG